MINSIKCYQCLNKLMVLLKRNTISAKELHKNKPLKRKKAAQTSVKDKKRVWNQGPGMLGPHPLMPGQRGGPNRQGRSQGGGYGWQPDYYEGDGYDGGYDNRSSGYQGRYGRNQDNYGGNRGNYGGNQGGNYGGNQGNYGGNQGNYGNQGNDYGYGPGGKSNMSSICYISTQRVEKVTVKRD